MTQHGFLPTQNSEDQSIPTISDQELQSLIEQSNGARNAPLIHAPSGSQSGPIPQAQHDPVQSLLAQLHDVKTPEPIGLWPFAMGWWILLVIVVFALSSAIYAFIKKYKENRYKRIALKQLEKLKQSYPSQSLNAKRETLCELISLLKKTGLSGGIDTRPKIANLMGGQFIELLARSIQSKSDFSSMAIRIENTLYGTDTASQIDEKDIYQLFEFAKQWILKCDRKTLEALQKTAQVNYQSSEQQDAQYAAV